MTVDDIVMAERNRDEKDPVEVPQLVTVSEPTEKISIWKRLAYHLWDADQHLKSPEERAFVRKMDCGILICATLGWYIKYIDQANIQNAYVTGMKEDLKMEANQYTICLMMYTISFAIMQVPANIIALKVRPRYCIIVAELGWTVFTFAQAAVTSSQQMYAFRFMVGLFESIFSPIIIFLLGSWYTRPELAKRIAIWHITGFFGTATSGFLQAGVHQHLDGRLGLPGWRWLYIICGCMSLPVALSVWFLLPDYPHNTKAWYITEADKEMARRRAANIGRAEVTGIIDLKLLKRMFGNWRWWVLCVMYIFYGNTCQSTGYFGIFLKSAGYSATQRNIIPACSNILTMLTDFGYGFFSDMTGNRYLFVIGPVTCCSMVGAAILTAWPAGDVAKIVAFFLAASGYCTGVVWTWANEINNGNAEERAITISSMNGLFYATNSFLPILLFPQTMAPTFKHGFPAIASFCVITVALVLLTEWFHRRELRNAPVQPESELPKDVDELDAEKELESAIQPVKNSAVII